VTVNERQKQIQRQYRQPLPYQILVLARNVPHKKELLGLELTKVPVGFVSELQTYFSEEKNQSSKATG
jgi:hypothetical protein